VANVMIVDDERAIRDSLQFHFESIGWHADVACDGKQAVKILAEKRTFYDGIVLDKNMPEMSGDEVVRWLYREDLLQDICVVLLTAYPEIQSAVEDLRMGVWQYLVKALKPSEVQTFIAPGIALKRIHKIRRELLADYKLDVVLSKIESAVRDTLAPDSFHVIFLSPFLSRDFSDGSSPSPNRKFVDQIRQGKPFIWAKRRGEVEGLEPVLSDAASLMAVRVSRNDEILGVLVVESRKEEAFDARWKEVLTHAGDMICFTQAIHVSLESQRLLAEEKTKQDEIERTVAELRHRIGTSLSIIQQSAADLQSGKLDEQQSGQKRPAVRGNIDPGFASGAATVANGPGVHHRNDADPGTGHWRHDVDLYFGACRSPQIAAGGEAR
jgi:CheY-like chemotaxis protein